MSNDGNAGSEPRTCVRFTLSIAPVSNADDRIVNMLGSFVFDLGQVVGCSGQTSATASASTTDQASNAFVTNMLAPGELQVELTLVDTTTQVRCAIQPSTEADAGTEAWFHLDEPEPVEPLAETHKTIRRRRTEVAPGGLGLLGMKSETRRRFGSSSGGRDPNDGDGPGGGSSGSPLTLVPKKR